MEDNVSLSGQTQCSDPQQQLLEQIEVRLETLRSITRMGADKYVPSGCWVYEAHDDAQALGLPGKPVRPAPDTWTFELEKAALDELRMWLEGSLPDDPWSLEVNTQKRWCAILDMCVNAFKEHVKHGNIRVWRISPRRLRIRQRDLLKFGVDGS